VTSPKLALETIMAADSATRPVRRVQFSTGDEAETEEFIRHMYVRNRTRFLAVSDDARFSATVADADGIAADHVRTTVDYAAATEPFGYFSFLAVYRGHMRIRHGRDETVVPAGETTFYPLGIALDVGVFDAGAQILRLPAARLAAVAQETAGIACADLRFGSITPVSPAMNRHWSALIDLVSNILLDENSPAAHPLLAEELTRTAAITALHTFPNTALTVAYQPGPGWVAPATVRRAAAFIQSHADQPVTLDQIAAAAGVSARALQYAFRRHYDTTPTGYLRRIRLELAEQDLRAAQPGSGLTVAAVAHRWGWTSPSQFTAAYRRRFGVPPSQTLRS
jgi:AraC-like DNA-binding protein